ncbi:MAG: hypothetical protein NT062_37745 [Proteobacteria bacterium]|nr:hypothetical protein [Pseudomonadota bacterium]
MATPARLVVAILAAVVVGAGAAAIVWAVAVRKGFLQVAAAGEGNQVFVVMAIAFLVFASTTFRALQRGAARR